MSCFLRDYFPSCLCGLWRKTLSRSVTKLPGRVLLTFLPLCLYYECLSCSWNFPTRQVVWSIISKNLPDPLNNVLTHMTPESCFFYVGLGIQTHLGTPARQAFKQPTIFSHPMSHNLISGMENGMRI